MRVLPVRMLPSPGWLDCWLPMFLLGGLFMLSCQKVPSEVSAVQHQEVDPTSPPAHSVQMQTDEADAAVAILEKARRGEEVDEEDWSHLLGTEGYRRLQERELAMGREFADESFRAFLLGADTIRTSSRLAETVAEWRAADLDTVAAVALAYLPEGTKLRATLYPVIKPKTNSFVFQVETDPAIFMFVDPEIPRAKLENTLAHELHHIGYAAACPDPDETLPESAGTSLVWAGAFGEGLAMLAAAGGPEIHPQLQSKAEDRVRWDRDVANFEPDLRRVEAFFFDVLEGRLEADQIVEIARSFFGVQGPWYTVGWKMAATIEEVFGRERLIASICDPRLLLATYNEAASKKNLAGETLPLWSPELFAHWAG